MEVALKMKIHPIRLYGTPRAFDNAFQMVTRMTLWKLNKTINDWLLWLFSGHLSGNHKLFIKTIINQKTKEYNRYETNDWIGSEPSKKNIPHKFKFKNTKP